MRSRPWDQIAADDLARLRHAHLLRERRIIEPIDATHVRWGGREYVNFSSNNYLGLTHHPRVVAAAKLAIEIYGVGAGAAPLISGYGPAHQSAERAIARWKGMESAVLLPSGYQANHAAIQTVASTAFSRLAGEARFAEAKGKRLASEAAKRENLPPDGDLPAREKVKGGVRFLVDKLAHASLIDAIRATDETIRVFPHNHIAKLRRLLEESPECQLQVVVTESIFSMDGDAADLRAIAELKAKHDFILLVDEAHASGVYGPNGNGLAAELGVGDMVDVSVMTLSKALGGIGGAVCGSSIFCEALINYARAYLFSTSIPPATAAAAETAVEVVQEEPGRRDRLRRLARFVRERIGKTRFAVPAGDSPIIPIVLGEEAAALAAAEKLRAEGLLVMAVRPPTVAKGSSRLRVTLSSEHTDAEIERLIQAVETLP
ncbi:MAG: 8-amino-7-oxononanoate synthase [Phycisphaerales bacterium]|nr:8-amino-7-oxononanoate synthase [Phycisphaerales bacterium]